MDNSVKHVGAVVDALLNNDAYKATKYVGEKSVVNATRKLYRRKILKSHVDIVLTIGKPNFEQREYIKLLKKAGEPFPVKRVILKFPPKITNKKTKGHK